MVETVVTNNYKRIPRYPQPKGRGPNGRRLCRWCHEEVPKGRRTFCSDGCVHEVSIRSNPNYQKQHVLERDHGVCDACGLDCQRLARSLMSAWRQRYRGKPEAFRRWYRLWMRFSGRAVTTKLAPNRNLWEMDHIVPVVEGGGNTGLENLRTLCVWCHNEATAHLRKRLARKRRHDKKRQRETPWKQQCSTG